MRGAWGDVRFSTLYGRGGTIWPALCGPFRRNPPFKFYGLSASALDLNLALDIDVRTRPKELPPRQDGTAESGGGESFLYSLRCPKSKSA